ncbi:hypothetical protein EG327_010743 [Venturia inaequalis]|uniref:Uncharacterized protein n=1 Tax=Venturia inaequalis TaxID=5025 RepID=A0A8H3VN27_VENIN|nr:hypothetical protein EG327_010743 [Venturia inaequalis]
MAPNDSPACMGKLYTFKTQDECHRERIRYWAPKGNAGGHMAVCVTEPDNQKVVYVVTVTSKDYDRDWEFVPMYRTSLERPNNNGQYRFCLEFEGYPSAFSYSPISCPDRSYLRLEPFDIGLEMLKPVHPNGRGAEHLSLTPESLHFVEHRLLSVFGRDFWEKCNPLLWNRSGEISLVNGNAKARMAEIKDDDDDDDDDKEMEESVEPAPSLTMTPEEVDDFLESMIQ